MFFYPYSDCEDRAVLFSRLVDMLTGLPGIGLSYPGHVAAAVKLPEEVKGDYVKYGRELYTVCDPTYMGAGIGRGMPEFDRQGGRDNFKSFEPDAVCRGWECICSRNF